MNSQFEKQVKILGEGSYGTAYLVYNTLNEKFFVIKKISISKYFGIGMTEQDFLKEAKILTSIKSNYVVREYHTFMDYTNQNDHQLCICMEYCEGGDLRQQIENNRNSYMSESLVWKYALEIMLGLRDLHSECIIHRDIKPENLFLTGNNHIKIGDLGIAKKLEGTKNTSTYNGTPLYNSPERINGIQYDEKCDIWSLGCIIYELCTSQHPFYAKCLPHLREKLQNGKYQPLPRNIYTPYLSDVIASCLRLNPNDRPSIFDILSQPQLIQIADHLGISLNHENGKCKNKELPSIDQVQVSTNQRQSPGIKLPNEISINSIQIRPREQESSANISNQDSSNRKERLKGTQTM